MSTPSVNPSQRTVTHLQRVHDRSLVEIDAVMSRSEDIRMAVISLSDGRAIAARFLRPGEKDRAAALVSSLLAICETAGKEFEAGRCANVIVSAEVANVIVM